MSRSRKSREGQRKIGRQTDKEREGERERASERERKRGFGFLRNIATRKHKEGLGLLVSIFSSRFGALALTQGADDAP